MPWSSTLNHVQADVAGSIDGGRSAEAAEQLAVEIDMDGATVRALWRWTCFQARTVSHAFPLAPGTTYLHP